LRAAKSPRSNVRIGAVLGAVRDVDETRHDGDARSVSCDATREIGFEQCRVDEVRASAPHKVGQSTNTVPTVSLENGMERRTGPEELRLHPGAVLQVRDVEFDP
jgi:hypothetical protein